MSTICCLLDQINEVDDGTLHFLSLWLSLAENLKFSYNTTKIKLLLFQSSVPFKVAGPLRKKQVLDEIVIEILWDSHEIYANDHDRVNDKDYACLENILCEECDSDTENTCAKRHLLYLTLNTCGLASLFCLYTEAQKYQLLVSVCPKRW
jgi:hypothetical protein